MICPHCRLNRRQRERANHTCSGCGKVFALDPKVDPGNLHDIKFRELVAKSAPDGLRITVEQLHWLNARRRHRFPTGRERRGSRGAGTVLAVVALAFAALAVGIGGLGHLFLGLPALLMAWLSFRQYRGANHYRPVEPFVTWPLLNEFEQRVVGRWRQVYGSLPDGLVEAPGPTAFARPTGPRAVVLCEPAGVLAFLRVNGFAERHRVLLLAKPERLPDGLPVLVVRDLSLTALARTLELRARFAGHRVVDCGLLPHAVRPPARAVRLRAFGRQPEPVPEALAASPGWQRLPAQDRDWLCDRWSSPLVSVPPVKLMSALDKAVERLLAVPPAPPAPPAPAPESAAETRRRAERVGFLTWPQTVPTPRTGSGTPASAPAPAPASRPTDGSDR
ncbi:hypothetical protein HUT16_03570 [Kitasatospora sp. NA04385]|uniref:hypothetical protein n=1 Tax=Kitasatospora sp. NA04385 TaxID=2742135 RepID=UPI0015911584|nr:hypothetical protein [Kitasatospora sp. NA04385]QKW18264.1 hypothetical protein HUT16_03570 [Kitasatospora sp. NA04385]